MKCHVWLVGRTIPPRNWRGRCERLNGEGKGRVDASAADRLRSKDLAWEVRRSEIRPSVNWKCKRFLAEACHWKGNIQRHSQG